MRKLLLISVFVLVAMCIHCDDCACDPGPFFGELKVRFTINEENPEVLLTIFEGKIEKQDTLFSEWVTDSPVYYDLQAGKYYSATVTYSKGIRQIVAVDGKKMTIGSDDCDCDYAENLSLNLKLAD